MSNLVLSGKNILVPRGKAQAQSATLFIQKLGGVSIEIPLIGFKEIDKGSHYFQVIDQISMYDWLVITSVNTAKFFLPHIPTNLPTIPKIAAIGEKTAQKIIEMGFHVDFMPREYVAEGFVTDFLPLVSSGATVLLPKGDLARNVIASKLEKHHVHVDELVIYQTYLPEESRKKLLDTLNNLPLHVLTFTSSSTVDHFMTVVKEANLQHKIRDAIVACIGPIAKKTAESHGLTVHVSPVTYTVEAMLEEIVRYLKNKN